MRPALLIVFVDAMGPDQAPMLVDAGLRLPHQTALRGVLGYSSGAIPTILTGAHPSVHGRMCLFSRVAQDGTSPLRPLRWLGLLPRVVHERARVRNLAAKVVSRARGYDGYVALHRVPPARFPGIDIPEKEDLFQARRIGRGVTFLEHAREAGMKVVATDWKLPEEKRIEQIEAAPGTDLAFLYLAGMDAILHRDGGPSAAAQAWSRRAAGWIGRAQRALARDGRDVRTLVVGDHGMARITEVVDPRPFVTRLEAALPGQFLFVDATMLRIAARPDQHALVRDILRGMPGELLDHAGLVARDAPADGSYGDLIHLLPEGRLFAPSFLGGFVKGMHGYDRTSPSARAAVLSDAPIEEELHGLEDIAPWVLRALEIPAASP